MEATIRIDDGDDYNHDVTMELPPQRRGRDYVVVESPWQGEDNVISYHDSFDAANKAARKHDRHFHRHDGLTRVYGYSWSAGRILNPLFPLRSQERGCLPSPGKLKIGEEVKKCAGFQGRK